MCTKKEIVKHFCLIGLLFFAQGVFAAVPIQEKSMTGAGAANARLRLLATAESYLGTPYRYGGLDRKGLDCSGLVYLSFREGLNYTIPRTAANMYGWVEKINTSDLQLGDLVFFVTSGSAVSHVGIYAGDGRFIHSASEGPQTGVMYSRLDESYWKRTYKGAGRALPWDAAAAEVMTDLMNSGRPPAIAGGGNTGQPSGGSSGGTSGQTSGGTSGGSSSAAQPSPGTNTNREYRMPSWKDPGFYLGFGAAWTWGGFFEGAPSVFRGISGLVSFGYGWSTFSLGLEVRPAWDRALGVFRLPITATAGTDYFQVFCGPAYTFGNASLSLSDGDRPYSGGGAWRFELGIMGAIPLVQIDRGIMSFYTDLAWQSYPLGSGVKSEWKPDATANLRLSTGLRFLWHF